MQILSRLSKRETQLYQEQAAFLVMEKKGCIAQELQNKDSPKRECRQSNRLTDLITV